jgi:hypothetical protein
MVVEPWGRFAFALNAAVQFAIDNRYALICFQSLEVTIVPDRVRRLVKLFDDDNVCLVGPVLSGHEFKEGDHVLRGRTCPWNTFAIWRVAVLYLTGFPLIADGMDDVEAGVEEVSAYALLKHIKPSIIAYLVAESDSQSSSSLTWDTSELDATRREWHEKKMQSKDERPAKHLQLLGLPDVLVKHVVYT